MLCWPLRKRRCQLKNEAVIEKMRRRWRFVTAKWRSFGQNQGDRDGGGLWFCWTVVFSSLVERERERVRVFFSSIFFISFFCLVFFLIFLLSIFLLLFFSPLTFLFIFFFPHNYSLSLSLSIFFLIFLSNRNLLFFLLTISLLFILHYLEIFLYFTFYSKNIFIEFFVL